MGNTQGDATQLAASLLRKARLEDMGRTLSDGTPILWAADIVTADAGDKIICLCTNDEDRVRREAVERMLDERASELYMPEPCSDGGDEFPQPGLPLVRVLFDPLL